MAAINITPLLGVGFGRTYSTLPGTGTGPNFPTEAMQYGMVRGKIMQGAWDGQGANPVANDGNRWILGQTVGAPVAAGAVNLNAVTYLVDAAGTIICNTPVAIPANSLAWFQMTGGAGVPVE